MIYIPKHNEQIMMAPVSWFSCQLKELQSVDWLHVDKLICTWV